MSNSGDNIVFQYEVTPPGVVHIEVSDGDPEQLIVWADVEEEVTEPLPSTIREAVRQQAWRVMGIPRYPDAALTKYAREQQLGAPLTVEFDFQFNGVPYRGQGFAMGVAFCKVGQWDTVRMAWW